jgi:hypothetical protein
VYTNAPELIYLYARGRPFSDIPEKFNPHTLVANDQYAAQMRLVQADLQKGSAVLLWSKRRGSAFLPSEGELKEQLRLAAIDTAADVTLYGAALK